MSDQININVTDLIPPSNIATIDNGGNIGNAVSKDQFNTKIEETKSDLHKEIQDVKALVETDFQGVLMPTDPAPTVDGSYKPGVSSNDPNPSDPNNYGTLYPNAGNLRARKGFSTMFYKKGTAWTRGEEEMPKDVKVPRFEDLVFPAVSGTQAMYQSTQWIVKAGQTAIATDLPSSDPLSKWDAVETPKSNFIYSDIYPIQDRSNFTTQSNNGNSSTTLTGINDRSIGVAGIISEIRGLFPAVGNLIIFIAKKRTLVTGTTYSFVIGQKYTIPIPNTGLNAIDVKSYNIKVDIGDYLGISTASTAKPYYGANNTEGFGWYRDSTGNALAEGTTLNFSLVTSNSFSFGFKVQGEKYAPVSQVYLKSQNDTLLASKVDKSFLNELTKAYNVDPYPTSSNGTAYMLNNVPVLSDGFIRRIRVKSADAGIAVFQILDRKTFNANAAGQADTFIARASFTVNVLAGDNSYDIPGNIQIKKGQYLALVGGTGNIRTPFNTSSSITNHLGWFQAQSGGGLKTEGADVPMTFQPFTSLFDFSFEHEIYQRVTADAPKYKLNKITATRNPENYNSIRNIIKAIIDASDLNEYEITIPNGEWLEADIQGKKNVYLVGQSKDAVIKFDAEIMASYVAPADYSYPSEAGKLFSAIALNLRHTFFSLDDINLKNLTVFCKSGKYPLHLDNVGFKKVNVENVRVIADNCSYVVGIGVRGGQSIKFENVILERVEVNTFCGVFAHNTTAQSSGSSIIFNRCKFVNCDYVLVDEVGSNQIDDWRFTNCFSATSGKGRFEFMVDKGGDGNTLWTNPATGLKEPDPRNVPYNILLNTTGTEITELRFRPASSFNASYTGGQRDTTKTLELNIIDYVS